MDSLLLMFRVFEVVSNIKCRRFSSMVEAGGMHLQDRDRRDGARLLLPDGQANPGSPPDHHHSASQQASRVKPKVVRWPLIETDRWMGYNTAVVGL